MKRSDVSAEGILGQSKVDYHKFGSEKFFFDDVPRLGKFFKIFTFLSWLLLGDWLLGLGLDTRHCEETKHRGGWLLCG